MLMVIEKNHSTMPSMKTLGKKLLIIIVLVLVTSGVARAGNSQIRATIAARSIVIVSKSYTITTIYSNTHNIINPEFRMNTAEGDIVPAYPILKLEYERIMKSVPVNAIGKIYEQPLVPSLDQLLYAML